jgi:hypothetical protein
MSDESKMIKRCRKPNWLPAETSVAQFPGSQYPRASIIELPRNAPIFFHVPLADPSCEAISRLATQPESWSLFTKIPVEYLVKGGKYCQIAASEDYKTYFICPLLFNIVVIVDLLGVFIRT